MAAPIGNTNSRKHTPEEWAEKMEIVYQEACKGSYNSLQQAWIENDLRPTTVKYLVKEFPKIRLIKEDINAAIISVINTKALESEFNVTAGIWRMKQLGETDKTEVTNTNIEVSPLTSEELSQGVKIANKLKEDF